MLEIWAPRVVGVWPCCCKIQAQVQYMPDGDYWRAFWKKNMSELWLEILHLDRTCSVSRINKTYISKGTRWNVRQVKAGLDAVRDHGQETWKVCWKARGIDHMWHSMFKVGFDMFQLSSFQNLKLLIVQTPGGKSQFTGLEVRCNRIGTVSWNHSIFLFHCFRFRKTCKLLWGPGTFSVRFEGRLRAKFKRAAGRMVLWYVQN